MGEVEYAPGEPKGTAWHPHRGFETVTYMIDGEMAHSDSNGGGGLISDGDTQWMTAGGGILHIETPPEHLIASGGAVELVRALVGPQLHQPGLDAVCDAAGVKSCLLQCLRDQLGNDLVVFGNQDRRAFSGG